jgi:hypothetical protein
MYESPCSQMCGWPMIERTSRSPSAPRTPARLRPDVGVGRGVSGREPPEALADEVDVELAGLAAGLVRLQTARLLLDATEVVPLDGGPGELAVGHPCDVVAEPVEAAGLPGPGKAVSPAPASRAPRIARRDARPAPFPSCCPSSSVIPPGRKLYAKGFRVVRVAVQIRRRSTQPVPGPRVRSPTGCGKPRTLDGRTSAASRAAVRRWSAAGVTPERA